MRILIACDKFKGTLSAAQAVAAIAAALPNDEIVTQPIADGGEGSAELLGTALGAREHRANVKNAIGITTSARYWVGDHERERYAFLDMSEACGLAQLPEIARDPWRAGSFGAGQLLLAAAGHGITRAILGLGGSATNDGGCGFAQALGFRFSNSAGDALHNLPTDLLQASSIQTPMSLDLPRIDIACDVDNPLLGVSGATRIYGPQKGIAPQDIPAQEQRLSHLFQLVQAAGLPANAEQAGAGAAGGLGFGAVAFTAANLLPGFDLISKLLNINEIIKDSELVITGEGRLDQQSLAGKGPVALARLAQSLDVPVVALCGQCSAHDRNSAAFNALFRQIHTLQETATSEPRSTPASSLKALAELTRSARPSWEKFT